MFGRTLFSITLLGLALAATLPAVAGGEIYVEGSYVSDDVGADEGASFQALTLRYITGNRTQFRVDLPLVRAEVLQGSVYTGVGQLPGDPGGGSHGSGSPGGGSMGSGSGAGSGSGVLPQVTPGDDLGAGQLQTEWSSGLGDLRMGLAQQIGGGGVKLYRADAVFDVKLPTADVDTGLGTGEWDARLGFAGEYRFWSATAFGGFGWNRLGDPEWVELRDPLDAFAGAESEPLAGERLILSGWVAGYQEVIEGTGATAAVGLGLRSVRGLRWRGSIAADVVGEYRRVAILFGISFGVSSPGPGIRGLDR
jgi:hypothetical protein